MLMGERLVVCINVYKCKRYHQIIINCVHYIVEKKDIQIVSPFVVHRLTTNLKSRSGKQIL